MYLKNNNLYFFMSFHNHIKLGFCVCLSTYVTKYWKNLDRIHLFLIKFQKEFWILLQVFLLCDAEPYDILAYESWLMSMSESWTVVHLWQNFGNLTKTKIGLTMFYQRCKHFLCSCPICVFSHYLSTWFM